MLQMVNDYVSILVSLRFLFPSYYVSVETESMSTLLARDYQRILPAIFF